MTTATEQMPQTLRSFIISKLTEFSSRETSKCSDQYRELIRTIKTPIERRIKLREALMSYTGDESSTNQWLNIIAIALNDESIAESTMMPLCQGCVLVPTSTLKLNNRFPINVPSVIYTDESGCYHIADVSGTLTSHITARDAIRYATDGEIQKFYESIGTSLLKNIMSGEWVRGAQAYVEGQPVIQPPIED